MLLLFLACWCDINLLSVFVLVDFTLSSTAGEWNTSSASVDLQLGLNSAFDFILRLVSLIFKAKYSQLVGTNNKPFKFNEFSILTTHCSWLYLGWFQSKLSIGTSVCLLFFSTHELPLWVMFYRLSVSEIFKDLLACVYLYILQLFNFFLKNFFLSIFLTILCARTLQNEEDKCSFTFCRTRVDLKNQPLPDFRERTL